MRLTRHPFHGALKQKRRAAGQIPVLAQRAVSEDPRWTRARMGSAPPPLVKEWRRGQTANGPVPARNGVGLTFLLCAEKAHRIYHIQRNSLGRCKPSMF